MKPSSSARIANTKSVSWTGRRPERVLRAVGQPLAEPAAGADRDLRLVELVAGALDVGRADSGTTSGAPSGSPRARRSRRTGTPRRAPPASTPSQRRLAPDMNSVATRIAPNTSAVPRSGWSRTRTNGGPARTPAPTIAQSEPSRPHAAAEVVREHDDHQDLGELAELELQPEDRDPARRAADAAADREREHEQAELDEVERPRERLEPVVVERGRDEEDGDRDGGPHERAEEHRAAVEDADAAGRRVAVGHRQPEARQQRGIDHELEVERRARRTLDARGRPNALGASARAGR